MVAHEPTSQEIVERVLEQMRARIPEEQAGLAEAFARRYYAGVAVDDLLAVDEGNLYGAALSHLNFARERSAGEPKIRVYNPGLEQHGWQSGHTVLEIVCDDMPFLVDSIRMAATRHGFTTHLLIHPVLRVHRDGEGRLEALAEEDDEAATTEAVMHFEVDRQTEATSLEALHQEVSAALGDVRVAVRDWMSIRERLAAAIAEFDDAPPPVPEAEREEVREFLKWIDDDHFTLLGYREYELAEEGGESVLRAVPDSALGLIRDGGGVSQSFSALPSEVRRTAHGAEPLVLTKSSQRSTVHRPSHLDYIGVKRFDDRGRVVGERRFVGLYTSAAYNRRPRNIPLLRRKAATVLEQAGPSRGSHAAKALNHILETFPRDLLFQIEESALTRIGLGILAMEERPRIRLFVYPDRYGRFFACLVYAPREGFNTEVRRATQAILEESFAAQDIEVHVQLSESALARMYYVVWVRPGASPEYDVADIERRLKEVNRNWNDELYAALLDHRGEERGTALFRRYGEAFRAGYRDSYPARLAVYDVDRMEELEGAREIAMSLYQPLEADEGMLRLKLFRVGGAVSLSDALPMLENMGLRVEDERPNKIKRADGPRVWMHDFGLTHHLGTDFELDRVRDKFQEAFARIWRGEVENDGFNRLVLRAGLMWREVVILRAYCKYLRQAGVTFSQAYMEETLEANPRIARLLVKLFHARFDPAAGDPEAPDALVAEVRSALDEVANLDQDRIVRSFLGAIRATLRTNYYQVDASGAPKGQLSFKFDPKRIPELPEPRPMFEIFVYSPRVEGIHLRGGPVARGGLRWSDRREDFRTEVLGLVKAQMVKNAVIIPVGSKGGFVPKRMPAGADREAVLAEGVACYQTFVRGLLDLTDNLVRGELAPPEDVVRGDGDDPYLVVAADKGTATFSDIANAIAAEYGFWLDDAFASGGSQGYDHKGMGITARGAWESVKRHFRERGLDTQGSDFTVIGIGDMSGDVFGNGMLLSRHIRMVGAFNHMHIFLDPDPDPARSFEERARLFALPRSTWADYDAALISEGGGIHSRTKKSIPLSPQVREALGIEDDALAPADLVRAMLKAPVDLLWNGGIGTYVKAEAERNAEVGDRANDAVRVNGSELRCKVVGEGGNLGFTQLGRIEFAAAGGRIHTDAIDNSAGVDCSDHEVNIKILLNGVVQDGDMTAKQRNEVLASMTDEVGALVLRNNYLQTQALSVAGYQSAAMLDVHARLIRELERHGHLDRAIEFLPGVEEIGERQAAGEGLTSPELSVLMAYCKITLFQDLLDSDVPDDPFLGQELEAYFPTPLRVRFAERMPGHRLAREIVSTVTANAMVNRGGITFPFRMAEETGAAAADIARVFVVASEVFGMRGAWTAIEALDGVVPAEVQIGMLLEGRKLVERASRWFLRNRARPIDIASTIEHFRPGAEAVMESLRPLVSPGVGEAMDGLRQRLETAGVPASLAARVAEFNELFSVMDLVEVAETSSREVPAVAEAYFRLGAELELHWLRDQINALPRDNRWQALSRAALRDDLYTQERDLTADALRAAPEAEPAKCVSRWLKRNADAVARCRQLLADLKTAGRPDFTMLSVAMREIRGLHEMARSDAPSALATRKKRRRKAPAV